MKARGHAVPGLHSGYGKAVLDLAADAPLGQPYRLCNSFHHTFLTIAFTGHGLAQVHFARISAGFLPVRLTNWVCLDDRA